MWYVIQVSTGKEDDIASKLKELNVKALIPKENRMIRSGGAWGKKEYVLFSGYVFLDMTYNAENYYKVKSIPGVIRFLGDSKSPSKLSYLEAEWIMLLTGKDNAPIEPTVVMVDQEAPNNLKVVSGILERFENRIIKYDKRSRRATFEITICGEKKEVQLSFEMKGQELGDIGTDAADGAAEQTLQYAT